MPAEFEKKQQNFESVAADLKKLATADEQTAIDFTSAKDKRLRRTAALRLMSLGASSPKAVEALVSLLQTDSENRVRSAAARALGEVSSNTAGVSTLVKAICDDHPNVRLYAMKSILSLDSNANAVILDFLAANNETRKHCPVKADPGYTLQQELLQQLAVQGARFSSLYIEGLSHPQTQVVRHCLTQIRKTGRSAASALPAMFDLMGSPDSNIRFETVQTFTTVGDQHPLVMPLLFETKQSDPSPKVQTAAENAIKRIQAQHTKANQANNSPKRPGKKPPQRGPRPAPKR